MGGMCGRLEYGDSWIMRVEFLVVGASPGEKLLTCIGGVKSESESSDVSENDSLMFERISCCGGGSSYSRRDFVRLDIFVGGGVRFMYGFLIFEMDEERQVEFDSKLFKDKPEFKLLVLTANVTCETNV